MRKSRHARGGGRLLPPGCMLLLLTACGETPPSEEVLRPVRTETVATSGGTRVHTFSGTARASRETNLSFRVSGRVDRIDVRVGQQVRAGQRIARLEERDFELSVQQSEASLDQAVASSRNADANLDRIRGLYENNNASQNELDGARAAADSARAQVESSRKALESAQRRLGYARLTAPVDGAIAAISVEVNENVTQGQSIVLLTSGSRAEVVIAMPEVLIGGVEEGDSVTVTFDALPGDLFSGTVSEVGVAAIGTATTFPVTVRIDRETPAIRPGMAANVAFRFESEATEESIYVPVAAVGEDRGGRFVFVLEPVAGEEDVGIVRRRTVEIREELTADGLQVLSGLAEGEQVVTAGVRRLIDGQRVRRRG